MRHVTVLAAILAPLLGAGCAVTRENQVACKSTATVLGALVGGAGIGTGVAIGTDNDGAGAGAGVGGAVLGGLVGYALGNHFCQVPEALAAPPPPYAPPPPPPPPPPAKKKIELQVPPASTSTTPS